MARLVLTNAQVVFGTNSDLSDHISSISLATSFDIVETTSFGQTAKTRVAGLADNSATFEFHQDYATSSVEQVIYPLLVSEWTPLNGGVGELATASVTWPISGVITKAIS
jgi:hypothetical protein